MSSKFKVTVFTRQTSNHKFPCGVDVVAVDYSDFTALTNALEGIDALVLVLGSLVIDQQERIIDAAIAVGVKRIIPSEFGTNLSNPRTRALPVFASKARIQDYLEEKTKGGKTSYTLLHTGPFLDWGLKVGFAMNIFARQAEVYDGGDILFSTSTLRTVGKTVVAVLSHADETKNRAVYVQDTATTQNKLLAYAKEFTPGEKWDLQSVNSVEAEKEAYAALAAGDCSMKTFAPLVKRGVFGEGYGGHFDKLDNELLGIKQMTDDEVKQVVKDVIEGKA
jgi:hypothetical protein